jgi:RHS repeat-associated protein
MYREDGEAVWKCELNSYGKVRKFQGDSKTDCPFRYQEQYEDSERGLYYNRVQYYSLEEGMYISQDPIGLNGGTSLYSYVHDTNGWVDVFGLSSLCQQEIETLPQYAGKTRAEIELDLVNKGYSPVSARSGGTVWSKNMADGTTAIVRVDPAVTRTPSKGWADERPHVHKESVSTSDMSNGDYGRDASVTKYDDANNISSPTSSTHKSDTHIPIIW